MLQNRRCSTVFKTWREENGALADVGHGKQVISDIENPIWDGRFPYTPPTKLPDDCVVTFDVA